MIREPGDRTSVHRAIALVEREVRMRRLGFRFFALSAVAFFRSAEPAIRESFTSTLAKV